MARKVIDLSIPYSNQMEGVSVLLQDDLPVYVGRECYAYDLEIKSHTGTYFETSSHVFRNGSNTDSVPLERLILPGYCVRPEGTDRCITADDLELCNVKIEPGSALLVDVGDDTTRYFSRDAAVWMVEKNIALMGSNTVLYDCGFENPTGFFIDLFEAEIPIIANVTNLDKLPGDGFTLIVMPLSVEGVCTVPCRVAALAEPKE